jgi:uncharacterized protein (DUF427 family)
MNPDPIKPNVGQESVWDYPRPPRLEPCAKRIRVVCDGVTVADTTRAYRVLETSHPPSYYIPPSDVLMENLSTEVGESWCEWKGRGRYYSIAVGDRRTTRAAWYYPDPTGCFAAIKDYIAFYAGRVDACFVDDERVTPQPGGFYGRWITRDIVGPFKGGRELWVGRRKGLRESLSDLREDCLGRANS